MDNNNNISQLVQYKLLSLLANLAADHANKDAMRNEGAIPVILQTLTTVPDVNKIESLRALVNLSVNGIVYTNSNSLQAISSWNNLQCDQLPHYFVFTVVPEANRQLLTDLGAVETIMLYINSKDVAEYALWTLDNLSAHGIPISLY